MRARDLWDVLQTLQVLATPTLDGTNTTNTDLQAPPADIAYVRDTWGVFQNTGTATWYYDSLGSIPAYWGLAQWS